jgi:hypothetical protein
VIGVPLKVPSPPPAQSRYAGQAVARPAEEITASLREAATQLPTGPADRADRSLVGGHAATQPARSPGVPGADLRRGEMRSVATRTLFGAMRDWVGSGMPEPDDRYTGRLPEPEAELAIVVRDVGQLLRVGSRRSVAGGGPAERDVWTGCSGALGVEDIALGHQQLLHGSGAGGT